MDTKDQIKKILEPHYGHLDFLMTIKKDEISIDDIARLVDLIKDKNLVNSLPKPLHSYKSYYTLLKDFFFIKKNMKLVKEMKDNLTSIPKNIILGMLDDEGIVYRLNRIINDDVLKSTFYRWSARINDEEFARFYIQSVIEDHKVWDELNGEQSKLIELYDYDLQSKYIPSSWCIKRRTTFYNYLRSQRIFIFKYKGKIYGVNVPKRSMGYFGFQQNELKMSLNHITIQNSRNNSVNKSREPELFKAAKTELLRLNLFGRDNKAAKGVAMSTPKVGIYMFIGIGNFFRRIGRIFGPVGPH